MLKLSEEEIISRIAEGESFECEVSSGAFVLKIEEYAPVLCAAVHNGHRLRPSLENNCLLSESERYYEEDPHTGELTEFMPITLMGQDSRYEYDLNRPIATCVYRKAWGKQVWKRQPTPTQRRLSIEKHRSFYRVLDALVDQIQKRFGACLIFDVHSYNSQRIERDTPDFNIGIEQIDMDRWAGVVEKFRTSLNGVQIADSPLKANYNDVFYGRGYLISHINSRFENTLVLPFEIKKFFMDEGSGELYPLVLSELKEGLKHTFSDTAAFFSRHHSRRRKVRRLDMLSSQLDPAISKVDQQLFRLARGMETLNYINPVNISHEKRRFFARKANYQPKFRYKPLAIDPYKFRERLYRLPVDRIRDPGVQKMYCDVIDGLSSKIDLLVNAGRDKFLYSSLKYYGEPSLEDEANAKFLLHATDYEEEQSGTIDAATAVAYFKARAAEWGMECKVEPSSKIVAAAMVSSSKKTLYVNRDCLLSELELNALAHHELGVHMATTINAASQPLKVFGLGLPGNTMTQEGLAILNELHSGNMSLRRLKQLALRVLAVKNMLLYGDFRHTYGYLYEEMNMAADDAFKLAVRVHRSGGFTKDYLYLRGISEAISLSRCTDISSLYVGKTGFEYLPLLNELIERGLIQKPEHVPTYLNKPAGVSSILDYLVSSIRPTQGHESAARLMVETAKAR